MFDTHCHLYIDPLSGDIDKIILKARENNVNHILIPGVDYKTSLKSIEIANCYNNVYSAVGIHPQTLIENNKIDNLLFKIEELIQNEKVYAVGEIGLDYYHKKNSENVQKELFEKLLILATKYNKSVIIHSRQASNDVIAVIKKVNPKHFKNSLVFHCSEPEQEILDFVIKNDFFIGIDGDITFDEDKQKYIKKVPLEKLVLETDSPYLAPTSDGKKDRGKINYPYYLPEIAKKVAIVKNIPLNNIIETTTKNALLLFGVSSGYN